jgi:LysM repeat protein
MTELRLPSNCPAGFHGRYTVVSGDTMYYISKRSNVSLEELANVNSHIHDPNIIYPGDVLCVPDRLSFPCSTILLRYVPHSIPAGPVGVTLIREVISEAGYQHALSVLAYGLPNPSYFGTYDIYEAFVGIPNIGGYGFRLFPTPDTSQETASDWVGTIIIGPFLTTETTIILRPACLTAAPPGPIVLEGNLNSCSS